MSNKKLTLISVVTILLGVLVAIGWFLNISILKSVLPGYVSMRFNTALCFIVAGSAFKLCITRKYHVIYILLSAFLIIIGFATFLQDVLNYDLGLDNLFLPIHSAAAREGLHPGRMAVTTSLCFTFLGLSFLFIHTALKVVGQYLLHLITVVAFIAITGYIINVPALYQLAVFSSMAIHTSLVFFTISIAASLINADICFTGLCTGKRIGNQLARKLFPKMTIAIIILGFLRIESDKLHLVGVEFGIALFAISFILVGLFLIYDTAILLNNIDIKRENAEHELMLNNKYLEDKVNLRTAELNRAMEKSRTAEANLKAVFNAAHVSIIETDIDGTIINLNRGAEILLGYRAEEIVKKHSPQIIHLEKEIFERGIELSAIFGRQISGVDVMIEIAKQGQYESRRWTYVRKDGTTFPVQLVVTAITTDEGEVKGFLGIATDISDLEKATSDLETPTGQLRKKNNQLLNFANIISHNLRSPVSNLNMVLYLYKESEDSAEKDILMVHFETLIKHLTETLNQLVDSLTIQEDKGMNREWLSFQDTFNKTKEIFIGTILETRAVITADFSDAPQIEYPKSYLESIFLNLLSNALKYRSPDRVPQITFKTAQCNNTTLLKVGDNGLGIDLNKHSDDLFGLSKTFHTNPEAKGVGLFMTKLQIEAMGGSITTESEVDRGTTFTIAFNQESPEQ
ncbi:hypothetical protein BH09BAC6_BH09BAC6_08270 [soil metagenome]